MGPRDLVDNLPDTCSRFSRSLSRHPRSTVPSGHYGFPSRTGLPARVLPTAPYHYIVASKTYRAAPQEQNNVNARNGSTPHASPARSEGTNAAALGVTDQRGALDEIHAYITDYLLTNVYLHGIGAQVAHLLFLTAASAVNASSVVMPDPVGEVKLCARRTCCARSGSSRHRRCSTPMRRSWAGAAC